MARVDWYRLLPPYWLQNERTDWEWDAMLNDLLDRYEPIPGHMTVTLGNVEVWVSNWPYGYGRAHNPSAKILPSVATRKRLKAAIPSEDPLAKVRAAVYGNNEPPER